MNIKYFSLNNGHILYSAKSDGKNIYISGQNGYVAILNENFNIIEEYTIQDEKGTTLNVNDLLLHTSGILAICDDGLIQNINNKNIYDKATDDTGFLDNLISVNSIDKVFNYNIDGKILNSITLNINIYSSCVVGNKIILVGEGKDKYKYNLCVMEIN